MKLIPRWQLCAGRVCLPVLALSALPWIAAPVLAADEAASGALAASRAAFDKDTKRLRAPEADELAPAAAAAAARSAAPQSMLRSPNALRFQQEQRFGQDGAETMRLDLQKSLRFTVARRNADGRLQKDCIAGDDAVTQRMPAAAHGSKETRHE